MTNILGIDLSLTATGLAVTVADPSQFEPFLANHRYIARQQIWVACLNKISVENKFDRWHEILGHIDQWARCAELVVIEGYSFGSHTAQSRAIAEIGGIVRYHLWRMGKKVMEVPPTVLKKFVTGKGNADKNVVLKEVFKRWNADIDDHNIADAFGLVKLGIAAVGEGDTALTEFQNEALQSILNPKAKKGNKRGGQ